MRLTGSDQLLGTPAYMSPEQVQNGPVGPASDLFSLGAVLYQAATGRAAFSGRHMMELLHAVATATPKPPHEVRPELPRMLSAFIMQLLAKDPAKRPASARAVVEELDCIRYQATTTRRGRRFATCRFCLGRLQTCRRGPPLDCGAPGIAAIALLVGGWVAGRPGHGAGARSSPPCLLRDGTAIPIRPKGSTPARWT